MEEIESSKFMKYMYRILRFLINIIAVLVLCAGVVLTVMGGYDLVKVFSHFEAAEGEDISQLMIIGLLHAIDLFLIAIVFFVLSIGMMVLFVDPDTTLPLKLPEWLRVKNFVELKIILWEAILTTLVVYYIAGLAEKKIKGVEITTQSLIVPAAVLLIALSLFFVKKEERHTGKKIEH
jgi:uncharacterized membrane protein YqhA